MRKIAVILFVLLLSNNSNAEGIFDNTIFGLTYINQNADISITSPASTLPRSYSGSGFGLYLDKYYKRKFRFNGTLSYINYESFDLGQLMVSADYLIPLNARYSFFTGAAVGGAIQKYSDASSIADSSIGTVYGVQAGVIAYINDYLMVELGYRLRPANIETELTSVADAVITVDDLSETYLSFLLMF